MSQGGGRRGEGGGSEKSQKVSNIIWMVLYLYICMCLNMPLSFFVYVNLIMFTYLYLFYSFICLSLLWWFISSLVLVSFFLLMLGFIFVCLSLKFSNYAYASYLQLCVIGAARDPTDAALSARHCWQFELKPDPAGSPSRKESSLDEHSGMVHITCVCWENEAGGWMSGGGRGCMGENQLIFFNF